MFEAGAALGSIQADNSLSNPLPGISVRHSETDGSDIGKSLEVEVEGRDDEEDDEEDEHGAGAFDEPEIDDPVSGALGSESPNGPDSVPPNPALNPVKSLKAFPRPNGMTNEEKSAIGKMVKRLLDHGRVLYLREALGMAYATQVRYCDPALSPECFMIVGRNK